MRSNVWVEADKTQVEYDSMSFILELMILQCVSVNVSDTFLTAQEISLMIDYMSKFWFFFHFLLMHDFYDKKLKKYRADI